MLQVNQHLLPRRVFANQALYLQMTGFSHMYPVFHLSEFHEYINKYDVDSLTDLCSQDMSIEQ